MQRILISALLLTMATCASALEFRSVLVPAAVLYDAPSTQARKLYILSQHYPVEVLVTLNKWMKVRDASGTLAWIEIDSLGDKRSVLVRVTEAEIFTQPNSNASLAFKAEQDVALELLAIEGAWLKVKHRDGATGYIAAKDVWGV